MNVGLIIWDDSQGDATITIVDEQRWNQILSIKCEKSGLFFLGEQRSTSRDREIWKEKILFYTLEKVDDCDPPENIINPVGNILYSIHSQNGVFENLTTVTMSIVGILTLNG